MSTIASPRQSTTSISPDRSRRSSLDTLTRGQATSPARLPRRNKTALRDYYNLKATVPADASNGQQRVESDSLPEVQQSELDAPGFDAEAYVAEVLGRESLQGLLKIESGLMNEIRGLDGEKKALVFLMLFAQMRTNMDPLIPTTSTLAPAISHIAETAASLAESLQEKSSQGQGAEEREDEVKLTKQRQRDTVRWVLAAPRRLRALVEGGRRSEAVEDWQVVRRLVEKWKGVDGAEEIKEQCLEIMDADTSSNAG
ncbi:MAG: hypothetical protein Q9185_002039 [Variospora sp. 1 TL-2023]